MKFDSFEALETLNKNFGNDASITVSNDTLGFDVTIKVRKNGEVYGQSFIVSHHDIMFSNVDVMNLNFEVAVNKLWEYLK